MATAVPPRDGGGEDIGGPSVQRMLTARASKIPLASFGTDAALHLFQEGEIQI